MRLTFLLHPSERDNNQPNMNDTFDERYHGQRKWNIADVNMFARAGPTTKNAVLLNLFEKRPTKWNHNNIVLRRCKRVKAHSKREQMDKGLSVINKPQSQSCEEQ